MKNIGKLTFNGHYVWVDIVTKIKAGDYFIEKSGRQFPIKYDGSQKLTAHCYKIIAADNELNLEDIPTYVEYLAENFAIDKQNESSKYYIALESFIAGFQAGEGNVYKRRQNQINLFTDEEKIWLKDWLEHCNQQWGFEPTDHENRRSIFTKLGINYE